MNMLNQNWFQNKRFVMFEEYAESQSFFDTETGNIYVVLEEYGQKGSTIVQEITPESFEYTPNYNRYKKFMGIKEKYRVTYTAQVNQTIEATSLEEAKKIAKNGTGEYENQAFEGIYLSEVAFITDRDGNEV